MPPGTSIADLVHQNSLGESSPSHTHGNDEKTTGPTYNIIEFDEDAKSRHFRAKVTDRAIDSVSDPLTLFLARRMEVQLKRSRRHPLDSDADTDDLQLELPGIVTDPTSENKQEAISAAAPKTRKALPASTEVDRLQEIFRSTTNNKLKLADSRLKQNNQSDFAERLSVLFLYAHELARRETVLRTDLNEVLSDAKVYDGNARKWIANTHLLLRNDDSIGLSLPGRERAREVLQQILDPNIETKWTLGLSHGRRTSKAGLREDGNGKQAGKKASRGRRQKGAKTQVRKLFGEDFFSKKRTSKDVQSELERHGYKFPMGRINEALLGLTKSDDLDRTKNDAGHWVFQKKHVQ